MSGRGKGGKGEDTIIQSRTTIPSRPYAPSAQERTLRQASRSRNTSLPSSRVGILEC